MPDIGPRSCPSHRPPRDFTLNTAYLDPSDWAEFGREHPVAAAWLSLRSLLAEAAFLEEQHPRSRRQQRRLHAIQQQLWDVPLAVV